MPTSFTLSPLAALLLALSSLVLALVLLGLVVRGLLANHALRTLARYFGHSFEDARDRPDGKLLTLFGITSAVLVSFAVGLITHAWPPDYIWISTLAFLATGYGFSAAELRAKIKADSDVKQAGLTGQPAPAPAAATTTTTTTVGLE